MQELTRQFGTLVAVNRLTMSVEAGEIFGLLGPNGAGKSTAIKMMTTLLPPTSGDAQIAGYSVTRQASQVRRLIGYVPQMVSADGSLSGYENLLIFAKLYGLPRREREKARARRPGFHGPGRRRRSTGAQLFRRHDPAAGDRAVHVASARGACSWTSRQWGWTRRHGAWCGSMCNSFAPTTARPSS
ncbi:MAG: hypothetical protein KatS3mg051_0759 [Anaerolineae bacterium]|nr:MAG: hypothetical protein KatS3mg051_0759 [Anaerolineae bacterium]